MILSTQNFGKRNLVMFLQKYWKIFSLFLVFILNVLIFWKTLFTPFIFGDDWEFHIFHPLEGILSCPDRELRFFFDCVLLIQYQLMGIDFLGQRLLTFLFSFISYASFYILLIQLFPQYRLLSLITVIFFILFPLDNYRHFSVIGGYTSIAYTFLFGGFSFLIAYARSNRWLFWILGILLLILSLGLYETGIGLIFGGSIGLLLLFRPKQNHQRVALIAPAILAIIYTCLRWIVQERIGYAYGYSTQNIELDLTELVGRIILGYRFIFQWGWVRPLVVFFPDLNTSGEHANWLATLIVFFIFGFLILITWLIVRLFYTNVEEADKNIHPLPSVKTMILFALGGLVMVGLGFFPIILTNFPSYHLVATRIFTLPSVGGTFFFVMVCGIIAILIGGKSRQTSVILVCLVIPFFILGLAVKLRIQEDVNKAWTEQKSIWQQLFTIAPDLASGNFMW